MEFIVAQVEPPIWRTIWTIQGTWWRHTLHQRWSTCPPKKICCGDWHGWYRNICPASKSKLDAQIYTTNNLLGGSCQRNACWNYMSLTSRLSRRQQLSWSYILLTSTAWKRLWQKMTHGRLQNLETSTSSRIQTLLQVVLPEQQQQKLDNKQCCRWFYQNNN